MIWITHSASAFLNILFAFSLFERHSLSLYLERERDAFNLIPYLCKCHKSQNKIQIIGIFIQQLLFFFLCVQL